MNRIVLAHSGGVGTLVAIPWLAEKYRAEVVTMTLDLGSGRQLDDVHERALAAGAARAHIIDVREEFARDFVLPALRADALTGAGAPMIRALGRSAIARRLNDMVEIERASHVAHGDNSAASGPSFETLLTSLGSTATVLAPARSWKFTPVEMAEFARTHGLNIQGPLDPATLVDANLWGRAVDAAASAFTLTKSAADTPDLPAYVDIEFQRGVPVAINGVEMGPVELIQSLETIAGTHGVGRVAESGVMCEAPAAVPLHAAHADLRRRVLTGKAEAQMRDVAARYAELTAAGSWFTDERAALDALVDEAEQNVSGVVRLKLHRGDCEVVSAQDSNHAAANGARG